MHFVNRSQLFGQLKKPLLNPENEKGNFYSVDDKY